MANIYDSPHPSIAEPESGSGVRCPFLGVSADPSTCLGYPSLGNLCHRVRRPEPVNFDHQECICLTGAHTTCPVFSASAASAPGRLPPEISGLEKFAWRLDRSTYGWVGGILAGLVLLLLLVFWSNQSSAHGAAVDSILPSRLAATTQAAALVFPTKSPTRPPSATPSPSPSATLSPTPTVSPTSTSTPTLAPPTPGPALETPFGPSGRYLLHRVQPGEGLINLARIHGTTADVIRFTNHILPGYPTYPDMLLVILPGQTGLEGLEKLRAIQLEAQVTLEELAAQEAVSIEDLIRLNDLGPHTTLPAGRWLILPRGVEGGS